VFLWYLWFLDSENVCLEQSFIILGEMQEWIGKITYKVLPKSSGNLNSTLEPVVVWPAAAKLGEHYPL
jgi:hypothetical protein